MPLYRDEGVVLRTHKLGEADRIVTVLTRRTGKIRAVAKGVRRTTSKFGARLEPFTRVDLLCHLGRSLDVVTQAETLEAYGERLGSDYPRYTTATAIAETAERLAAEEREPAPKLYLLFVGALRALAAREHAATLVLDAFCLRALTISGWAPATRVCARCGAPGPHRWFAVAAGGSVCAGDRPAGAATVSADALALLDGLLTGDWPAVDETGSGLRREASGLVAAYLQFHLERRLRSLPLVERT